MIWAIGPLGREDHFQSNVGSVTWATVFPKATVLKPSRNGADGGWF